MGSDQPSRYRMDSCTLLGKPRLTRGHVSSTVWSRSTVDSSWAEKFTFFAVASPIKEPATFWNAVEA